MIILNYIVLFKHLTHGIICCPPHLSNWFQMSFNIPESISKAFSNWLEFWIWSSRNLKPLNSITNQIGISYIYIRKKTNYAWLEI